MPSFSGITIPGVRGDASSPAEALPLPLRGVTAGKGSPFCTTHAAFRCGWGFERPFAVIDGWTVLRFPEIQASSLGLSRSPDFPAVFAGSMP